MLRLAAVAVTVGLADSLNPSTVGPALLLATGAKAALRVAQFTLGVFTVTLLAGLVLTLGPGTLLVGLVPHPNGTVRHGLELGAGVLLIVAAVGLWVGRRRLAHKTLPMRNAGGGSALAAGASIAALELLTAVPYFAVTVGIVSSSVAVPGKILLVVLYNVMFVAPLLAIVLVLLVAGASADRWIQKGGAWLQRRWPVVLASLLLVAGGILTVLGGAGLVRS